MTNEGGELYDAFCQSVAAAAAATYTATHPYALPEVSESEDEVNTSGSRPTLTSTRGGARGAGFSTTGLHNAISSALQRLRRLQQLPWFRNHTTAATESVEGPRGVELALALSPRPTGVTAAALAPPAAAVELRRREHVEHSRPHRFATPGAAQAVLPATALSPVAARGEQDGDEALPQSLSQSLLQLQNMSQSMMHLQAAQAQARAQSQPELYFQNLLLTHYGLSVTATASLAAAAAVLGISLSHLAPSVAAATKLDDPQAQGQALAVSAQAKPPLSARGARSGPNPGLPILSEGTTLASASALHAARPHSRAQPPSQLHSLSLLAQQHAHLRPHSQSARTTTQPSPAQSMYVPVQQHSHNNGSQSARGNAGFSGLPSLAPLARSATGSSAALLPRNVVSAVAPFAPPAPTTAAGHSGGAESAYAFGSFRPSMGAVAGGMSASQRAAVAVLARQESERARKNKTVGGSGAKSLW